MRQSGRVRAASVVKGITYRTLRHRARDCLSSRNDTAPKPLSNADRVSFRRATDGANPSSRMTVEDSGLGNPSNQDATWSGKCAAADTSHDEPIAAAMAAQARASSRAVTNTVASVSAFGRTLIVMSVIAASVPQE